MNAEETARELGGAHRSGEWWMARCPVHDDKEASLAIKDDPSKPSGVRFKCFAGCAWTDVLNALTAGGLIEWKQGQTTSDAARGRSPFHLGSLGEPRHVYDYRTADGRIVQHVARYEPSGKKKEIRQCSPDGKGGVIWKKASGSLPLYRLPELLAAPQATVLIVEGEKCVEAGVKLFGDTYAITTWAGGTGAMAKTDFSPLIGRTVTLWPDNDKPGRDAMRFLAAKLGNGATKITMVEPGERPEGWDVADAVAEGWSASELQTFLDEHVRPVAAALEERSLTPDEKSEPRIRCVPLTVIAATRAEWIIKGLLPRHGIGSILGEYSCGKSFLAFDLAATIARGLDNWRGYRVKARGAAIYIAAEGAGGAGNRVSAYVKHHGIEVAQIALEYVTARIDLRTPGAQLDELITAIRDAESRIGAVVLVVIDTLARTMPGGSDSKAEDMSAYIENCAALGTALDAFVLVVHHFGKDPLKGSRGSTVLPGAVDVEIEVRRDKGGDGTITLSKVRDGRDGDEIGFRLEVVALGEDADGDPVTSCVVVSAEASSATQKKKNLSGTANTAIKALREAIEAQGEATPETSTIPRGVRATTLGRWRQQFALRYGRDGKTEREPETVDRAFRRGKEELLKHPLIGISDPYVWVWS